MYGGVRQLTQVETGHVSRGHVFSGQVSRLPLAQPVFHSNDKPPITKEPTIMNFMNSIVARAAAQTRGAARGNVAGLPSGAQAANMDGCAGGCAVPQQLPPMSAQQNAAPYIQENSLLGIFVQPANTQPTTIEISCGNTFFEAIGARSFTPANSILLTSIVSGFQTRNQLCPGSGIDVAYFGQSNECYCDFNFGCFSQLAPLSLTFDPIDSLGTTIPALNVTMVGRRMEMNSCFPPGLMAVPTAGQAYAYQPSAFPQVAG